MEKNDLTDEQLVENFKNGDSSAFDALCARYKYILKAGARSLYLAGGDNDDLLQEGIIGLLKAASTFNGKSSFKSYAYLCIRSKMLTAVKSAQSAKYKPLNGYVSIYGSSVELDKLLYENPEQQLINRENSAELMRKINNKLSKYEIIVLGFYLDGLSYSEIGNKLGKEPKSIDNALQRIRKKLSGFEETGL